jgi:hypothetical protein
MRSRTGADDDGARDHRGEGGSARRDTVIAGPPGRQHRGHAFRALEDPEVVARAVRVSAGAERRGGTSA